MTTYYIGSNVRLTCVFKNAAGTSTDPTAITLYVGSVSGPVVASVYLTDANLVKDATGTYHYDYVPAKDGQQRARWVATGAVVAAAEQVFDVTRTQFP